MVESKRINNLTIKYGDELVEVVKGYEGMYTLEGYVDRDKIDKYISGDLHLELQQELWDSVNGGNSIEVATQIINPQVVLYKGNYAEVVAEVHTQNVRYGINGPEIIRLQEKVLITRYRLQRIERVWKVLLEKDGCGLRDTRCIREIKHIEKKWYHFE